MPIRTRLTSALLSLFALLACTCAHADAPSQTVLLERYKAASVTANLTDPALKPWHMRASFDLLDTKGDSTEHGTLDEWWQSPDHWHQRISAPSFAQDRFRVGDQSFATYTGHIPYFVSLLLPQLLDPLPSFPAAANVSITQQTQSFGQVKLDCLLIQPGKLTTPPAFGRTPTYCLEQQHSELRFFMEYGMQQIVRNRPATFQGKSVALSITVEEAGRPVLRAAIDDLKGGTVLSTDLTPPPDMPARTMTPRIGSGVIAGMKIGGDPPHYPQDAKMRHVSGAVLLHAVIGTDGHVHSLEPIYSPDDSLTKAATEAVTTWTYQPYLLNGQPTEVETTITVNFNISG